MRLYLEYCVPFWSPYYRKDAIKLESFTRMLTRETGLWGKVGQVRFLEAQDTEG